MQHSVCLKGGSTWFCNYSIFAPFFILGMSLSALNPFSQSNAEGVSLLSKILTQFDSQYWILV